MGKVNLELGSFFLVPDWSKSYNLTSLMTEIQMIHFFRIESQVFSISLKCLIFGLITYCTFQYVVSCSVVFRSQSTLID